jgi:hypothetical protein
MGKETFTSDGTFTPKAGITTYNFVVIGGGGGARENLGGGSGAVVKTKLSNIASNLNIKIGGGGFLGGGGGLTQVFNASVAIIAGGGGGGEDGGNAGQADGSGGAGGDGGEAPGEGGSLTRGGAGWGVGGGAGGIPPGGAGGAGGLGAGIYGGGGGAYNQSGAGGAGGSGGGGGGGGGAGVFTGITGIGGGTGGGKNGGGGSTGSGGGGGAGFCGGGGGGFTGYAGHGSGGAGSSAVFPPNADTTFAPAPDPAYGTYGAGGNIDIDGIGLGQDGYVEISWVEIPPTPIISDICFPAGTPIQTDQGFINIEYLDTKIHTLRGQPIQYLTQTITLDKYLIRFAKDALAKNVPSQPTVMSKDHKILFNGQFVPAYRFLALSTEVKKVAYAGEVLYNVLLAKYSVMQVNNLTCETLHPHNNIAKLYRSTFSPACKQQIKAVTDARKRNLL